VAGTFSYSPTIGTVLGVGEQTLSVSFTPTDATDYSAATATVTLTVNSSPVSISVTPATLTLSANQVQQITANVGNTSNTSVTWAISPTGVGTLSASGLYTAPATITALQTVTVTATSQADTTKSASATITLSPTPCGPSGYSFQRTITIDHTKVPNTDQANFPFLFNTTDPVFATTANGGMVANSNGYDIIFSADAAGLQVLNFEVEHYNPVTGQIVAWVQIPTLSHTTDTVVYVSYGNSSISTPQENPSAVWDSNFSGVYHLTSTGSGVSVADSTSNGNSGIAGNNGISLPSATTGVFGTGAGSFNGSQGIYLPSFSISAFTVSAWILPTASGSTGAFFAGPTGALKARMSGNNNLDVLKEANVDMGSSAGSLTINSWNHVVISYDGTTASFYIDGSPAGTDLTP